MKTVQVPYDVFLKLMRYFCLNQTEYHDEIQRAVEAKIDRMASRQRYAQAMAAGTDQERQDLLREYYNKKNMLSKKSRQ